jgi:hypothetical protein
VSWGRNQWMHRRLFHLRPRGATNRSTSAESPGRGAYKDTRLFHHGPWTWRQTVLKRPASSREANYRQCLECQAGRRIGGECVCMWIRIITEHIISNACRCHKVQCPCPVSRVPGKTCSRSRRRRCRRLRRLRHDGGRCGN